MRKNRERTSSKIVIIVMIITLFARFFGLLREILMARYYGTSIYTDAYIIANNIPTVVFDTLGQALLTSFIPMYSKICHEENKERANLFTIRLIIYLMIICVILTIVGEVFTKQIVVVFASGVKGKVLDITIQFTRILFPSLFAMTLLNLFTGYLQIYQKFELATSITVIGNLIIILTLIISNIFQNVYIFVWGSLIGIFSQVAILIPSVIKQGLLNNKGYLFKRDRYVRLLIPLLVPVFIGSALNEINSIIDRTMVSGLGAGAVSTLNYAYKIISLAISVIATPLITFMYPKFSALAAKNDEVNFRNSIHKCFNYILVIIIPISVIIFVYRSIIVKILFERGNFDSIAASKTSYALACYTVGLTAMAVQQILIRVYYAKQNTVTPMFNGIICAAANIGLDYVLIQKYGFVGASIATSIVAIIACIILSSLLCRKNILESKKLGNILLKNIVSGLVMLIFLTIMNRKFFDEVLINVKNILLIGILLVISGGVYLLMQILVKNDDITSELFTILNKKLLVKKK